MGGGQSRGRQIPLRSLTELGEVHPIFHLKPLLNIVSDHLGPVAVSSEAIWSADDVGGMAFDSARGRVVMVSNSELWSRCIKTGTHRQIWRAPREQAMLAPRKMGKLSELPLHPGPFFPCRLSVTAWNGELFISGIWPDQIVRISESTQSFQVIAGSNSGCADGLGSVAKFNGPQGMCCLSSGDLLVCDKLNNRIRHLHHPLPDAEPSEWHVSTLLSLGPHDQPTVSKPVRAFRPQYLCVDPRNESRVFFTFVWSTYLGRFDRLTGCVSFLLPSSLTTANAPSWLDQIACDPNTGYLYVSGSTYNGTLNSVYRINPDSGHSICLEPSNSASSSAIALVPDTSCNRVRLYYRHYEHQRQIDTIRALIVTTV